LIVQVKIPDTMYEQYVGHNPTAPERAIEQTLLRFAGVKPSERILILPSKERSELEVMLDSHFSSARELVSKVKELLSIKVEGVTVALDPNVLYRLGQQAEFEGQEPKAFLEQKIGEGVKIAVDGSL
jgi:hypothetical protein